MFPGIEGRESAENFARNFDGNFRQSFEIDRHYDIDMLLMRFVLLTTGTARAMVGRLLIRCSILSIYMLF